MSIYKKNEHGSWEKKKVSTPRPDPAPTGKAEDPPKIYYTPEDEERLTMLVGLVGWSVIILLLLIFFKYALPLVLRMGS